MRAPCPPGGGMVVDLRRTILETDRFPMRRIFPPHSTKKMTPHRLKPRQRRFVDAVHGGATLAAAAREAGYAASSARQTGSRLMQHPVIIEALERRRTGYNPEPPVTDDPRAFLLWIMNDPEMLGMRERVGVAAFLTAFAA